MLKIEMLPAGYGDSILIEYGKEGATSKVLIDAGIWSAFDELAARFKKIIDEGASLELFVVTHIDSDHIDGAVTLLNSDKSKLKIKEIWFNSYDKISDVLGVKQADMLSKLIEDRKTPWNTSFGGRAVTLPSSSELKEIKLKGGLKLTLLSPTRAELEKLKPVWEKEAKLAHITPGSREDALKLLKEQAARYETPPDLLGDKTPNIAKLLRMPYNPQITETNQSSIAFLAEYEGKSCLLTGDASPLVLCSSITSLLKKRNVSKLKLDAVKVSHHGSRENTSPQLQELLECKKFLVSTNGKTYYHPHQESIARIIKINGPDTELIFNYRSPQNDVWDNEYLKTNNHFKTTYPKNNDEGITVIL
jgi:beta-lactamase superfamily II metal-dependent hydrolase